MTATATRQEVLDLTDCDDVAMVGEKAYTLGRLLRAGYNVPRGVVLTVDAFARHHAAGGVPATSVDECTLTTLAAAGREPSFADGGGPVVVRSSAVGEDGAAQSFAGQLESVLHVRSLASLESAVLQVWRSYWSDRVRFYRNARGVAASGIGVIVQRQVDAFAAGVMFTSSTEGQILIELTAGLADRLVAGDVDGERVVIDRDTGAPAFRDDATTRLSNATIAELHRIALALERELGGPQDVEWALGRDGVVYIVQSRAITATVSVASLLTEAPSAPSKREVWSNANINENYPRPVTPLLYSIATAGYTNYFRNLALAFGVAKWRIAAMEPAFRRIIGAHGGRMYYNLSAIHSALRLAPFGRELAASFDEFVGADGSEVATQTARSVSKAKQLVEAAKIVTRAGWHFATLEKRVHRFERRADDFAARTDPARLNERSVTELGDLVAEFMEIRRRHWVDASLADAASMLCYGALAGLLRRAYAETGGERDAVHTSLLKAIPGVVSGEPVLALWELSRIVRADRELHVLVERETPQRVVEMVAADARFARFHAELASYLDRWGFRCSEELMLDSPSFQEDPAPVIDMLRAYARVDGLGPRESMRQQAAERELETERVLAELRGRVLSRHTPVTYSSLVRLLLPWTHAAIRYRERVRLKQALLYSRCRRIALTLGEALVRRGLLASVDDVFFLTADELIEIAYGGSMLPDATRAIVVTRRAEHVRVSAMNPPDTFTLDEGEHCAPAAVTSADEGDSDVMRGTPACGGRARGRATVLASTTEAERLSQGDVLVTRQTDPGWGPVFFLISGLVIERGGMLSHGAIIAREFGIPCVVGVKRAMERIADGGTIEVNGDTGSVHVVD
jgi:phosphohistidine swiveling domain-containing protein